MPNTNLENAKTNMKTRIRNRVQAGQTPKDLGRLAKSARFVGLLDDAEVETDIDTQMTAAIPAALVDELVEMSEGIKELRGSSADMGQVATTDNLTEGGNKFLKAANVQSEISVAGDLSYDNGVVSYTAPTAAALQVVATVGDLPLDATAGTQAVVTANNKLYIRTADGWYAVALINTAPTISGNTATYELATDGTPTVITMTATDPENDPVTFSHSVTSGSLNGTTVTQNDNVFTVTPHASQPATFELAFSADDSVNVATSSASSFTLVFVVPKIVVGSSKDDDNGNDSGAVYIYDIDGTNEIKIGASDAAAGDEFGHSVTVGDNKIVVGAHKRNFTRGAVYVYDMDGTNEIKITTSDQVQSSFGHCVAVGDNKVAVGGYGYNVGGSWRGRAYIYDLDGSNEVILQASDTADDDYFGWSIAVGHNKVAVGALHDDDNANGSGSVYVYDLDGTNEIKITASDAQANDRFGEALAIGNNKIVVGVPYEDDPDWQSGAVYVYDMDGTNELKISSSDIENDDRFGTSVAVGNNKIVVGAPHERGSAFYGGSVYVYDLDGTNEIKIMGSDTADSDQFGSYVAIHDSKIVVGTKYTSTTYVYDLDGSNEVKISVDGRAVSMG